MIELSKIEMLKVGGGDGDADAGCYCDRLSGESVFDVGELKREDGFGADLNVDLCKGACCNFNTPWMKINIGWYYNGTYSGVFTYYDNFDVFQIGYKKRSGKC